MLLKFARMIAVSVAIIPCLASCSAIPGVSSLLASQNVGGDWVVTEGSQSTTMTLADDNGNITGTYANGVVPSPVKGTRTQSKIDLTATFTFGVATASTKLVGDLSSDGKKITGTDTSETIQQNDSGAFVTVPASGSTPFTAVRK